MGGGGGRNSLGKPGNFAGWQLALSFRLHNTICSNQSDNEEKLIRSADCATFIFMRPRVWPGWENLMKKSTNPRIICKIGIGFFRHKYRNMLYKVIQYAVDDTHMGCSRSHGCEGGTYFVRQDVRTLDSFCDYAYIFVHEYEVYTQFIDLFWPSDYGCRC